MKRTIVKYLALIFLFTGCSSNDNGDPQIIDPKPQTKKITVLDNYIVKEVHKNLSTGQQAYRSKSIISLSYNDKGQLITYNDDHEYFSNLGHYIKQNNIVEYKYNDKNQLIEIEDYPDGKDQYYKLHRIEYNSSGFIKTVELGGTSFYAFSYDKNNFLTENNRYTYVLKYNTDSNGNIIKVTNDNGETQELTYDTSKSPFFNLPINNTFTKEELPFAYNERNNLKSNTKNKRNITYRYNTDNYPTESKEILQYSGDRFEESIIIEYFYKTITIHL